METVKFLLFENPVPVCVAMVIAESVVLAIWCVRRTRRSAVALLLPPLLAGAVVLAGGLVKTDREQIVQALGEIAASAEAGHLRAAGDYLDRDCQMPVGGATLNRQEMIELGRSALGRHRVQTVAPRRVRVTVADERADATLITVVTLAGGERFAMDWEVTWAKRQEGWRIVHVRTDQSEMLDM